MARHTPALRIEPLETSDGTGPVRRGDVISTLASACIHALFLVFLALFALPSNSGNRKSIVEMAFDGDESFALDTVDLSTEVEMPTVSDMEPRTAAPDIFQVAKVDFAPIETEPVVDKGATATADAVAIDPAVFAAKSLSSSATVEGAVDRITGQLMSKLEKDDLLVVWLLDASRSLVDDRKRVAARLTPFYDGLVQQRSSSQHMLLSAVVAFGTKTSERVAPTEFGDKIIAAVDDVPVDRSGDEKVFAAVARCAQHYRQAWDKQVVIVIWTDESGDDSEAMEATIAICRQQNVSVSVVGPSSVLGAYTGLHAYIDPKTKKYYEAPVMRGPDAALPERLELGYWYRTRFRGGRRGALPLWLGGQDLEGILSGFSPYSMTRLTQQTGGSYTIFDHGDDRSPFDLALMKSYAPSHASLDQYWADIKSKPIRRAVMNAVLELGGKNVDAPTTMLFVQNAGRNTDFIRLFYTPSEFRNKLRAQRGRLKAQATRSTKIVEEALRHVSFDASLDVGLDDDYEYEKSPRWRAWYDLTRGRLLATSVRLEEYRLTIDALAKPNSVGANTNHVILVGSQQMRSDTKYQKQADEAERLLRRCVNENRGTPWEILAQRELDYALGVGVREASLTPTPLGPATRQPSIPRF